MGKLKDKIIVITGGNGLLGREIINKITQEGGFCINIDISHETSLDFTTMKCDITNFKEVENCIENIILKYSRIDGLVNNAYPRTSDWGVKFEDIKYSSWQQNIDFQLNSYFFITQQVSSYMVKNKHGSIVNIASIYGVVGPDFRVYENTEMTMPAAYSAIKGGIINFTRYLASYLGPQSVRTNAVSPGGIFDNQNIRFVNQYSNKVPMRRMGNPDDISPVVVFLLSEDSKYITGQNIIVDGGWTAI
jgi:NAD(P)-dependent dehydrogenase (short-subunit alcohol dehydrogenase family)